MSFPTLLGVSEGLKMQGFRAERKLNSRFAIGMILCNGWPADLQGTVG